MSGIDPSEVLGLIEEASRITDVLVADYRELHGILIEEKLIKSSAFLESSSPNNTGREHEATLAAIDMTREVLTLRAEIQGKEARLAQIDRHINALALLKE